MVITLAGLFRSFRTYDEIKHKIMLGARGVDVAIVEIGGTVGDVSHYHS